MIESFQRVVLIPPTGANITLVDFGQLISAPIVPAAEQAVEVYDVIDTRWGKPRPKGTAKATIAWSTERPQLSHRAALSFCHAHEAALPMHRTCKVRVTLREPGITTSDDDEAWEYSDVVINAAPSLWTKSSVYDYATITSYRLSVGARSRISGSDVVAYTPPALSPSAIPAVSAPASLVPAAVPGVASAGSSDPSAIPEVTGHPALAPASIAAVVPPADNEPGPGVEVTPGARPAPTGDTIIMYDRPWHAYEAIPAGTLISIHEDADDASQIFRVTGSAPLTLDYTVPLVIHVMQLQMLDGSPMYPPELDPILPGTPRPDPMPSSPVYTYALGSPGAIPSVQPAPSSAPAPVPGVSVPPASSPAPGVDVHAPRPYPTGETPLWMEFPFVSYLPLPVGTLFAASNDADDPAGIYQVTGGTPVTMAYQRFDEDSNAWVADPLVVHLLDLVRGDGLAMVTPEIDPVPNNTSRPDPRPETPAWIYRSAHNYPGYIPAVPPLP